MCSVYTKESKAPAMTESAFPIAVCLKAALETPAFRGRRGNSELQSTMETGFSAEDNSESQIVFTVAMV